MRKIILWFLAALCFALPARANVPCSVPFTLTNGSIADASQVMANYNALIACFTNAAAAGANSDITSLNALTTPIPPVAGGSNVFLATAPTGGTATAQTVATTTPSGFALTFGFSVYAKIGITNTGPTTLTVGSTATTSVFKRAPGGPVALTGGELQIGDVALFVFDGTQYELLGVHREQGGFDGPAGSVASASTTDVASTGAHFVNITGTTTITNLGNTLAGQTAFPRYLLTLNGSQINFNATNCATTGGCIATPGNVNVTTSSAGESVIARYTGQGSNLGAGAGNWTIESMPRSAQGIARRALAPQVFTASGTYTPTVGMLFADVECLGGGGAGGGVTNAVNNSGGGGGAAGYARGFFSAATIGASQTVTIGAAGTGVSAANGNAGGNTTFGALLTANGGSGGNAGDNTNSVGGNGGTATGGYLQVVGDQGLWGFSAASSRVLSGKGANSIYGSGGRYLANQGSGVAGVAATGFGAGGGGAVNGASSAANAGGNGSGGICLVTEFIQ